MLISGLVLYLGFVSSTAANTHEFRHVSLFSATEDISEFESDAKESSRVFVGGFQLTEEDDFSLESCNQIEGQFESKTNCACSASLLRSNSVQFGCEHVHNFCNQWNICGKLVYAGTVEQESPASSSNFCIKNLRSLEEQNNFGDLCVTVEYDRNQKSVDESSRAVNRCNAQLGRNKCSCTTCGDGDGLRLDCSDTDSSLISTQCDKVSLVTTIKGKENAVRGYFPSFRS